MSAYTNADTRTLQLCALRWVLLQRQITHANDACVEMTRHWKWHNRRTYCRNWFSCLGIWGITWLHLFLATGFFAQSVYAWILSNITADIRAYTNKIQPESTDETTSCFRKCSEKTSAEKEKKKSTTDFWTTAPGTRTLCLRLRIAMLSRNVRNDASYRIVKWRGKSRRELSWRWLLKQVREPIVPRLLTLALD
jgi:hypothetical protein